MTPSKNEKPKSSSANIKQTQNRDILKGNLTVQKCQGTTKRNDSALKNIKMTRQLKAIKDPELGFRGNVIFFLERILLDNW